MGIVLDKNDRAIIKLLQEDSSISNLDLSKRIGLSPSACLARTKNLEESGIIKQYTMIVDEKKLGLETQAFVLVNLMPLSRESAKKFVDDIKELSEVQECYMIAGNHDYILKVVVKDMYDYKTFLIDKLLKNPTVNSVTANIVMSEEKRTTVIPIDIDEETR